MAFDGKPYSTSGIIPPHAWAPKGPLSGEVGQESLQGSYYQARHGAKMLMCQPYPWNSRNGARNSTRNHQVFNANWWRTAECFVDMPPMATHLVALVSFAFIANDEHVVKHRLVVTDGLTTDTGTASEVASDSDDMSVITDDDDRIMDQHRKVDAWAKNPTRFWGSVKVTSCEVELDNHYYTDDSGTGLEVYVETVFTVSNAFSVDAVYKPGFIWVGYQVRG